MKKALVLSAVLSVGLTCMGSALADDSATDQLALNDNNGLNATEQLALNGDNNPQTTTQDNTVTSQNNYGAGNDTGTPDTATGDDDY